jgi:hypothetical protein
MSIGLESSRSMKQELCDHVIGTRSDWNYRETKPQSGLATERGDTAATELIEVFDFCPLCGARLNDAKT